MIHDDDKDPWETDPIEKEIPINGPDFDPDIDDPHGGDRPGDPDDPVFPHEQPECGNDGGDAGPDVAQPRDPDHERLGDE